MLLSQVVHQFEDANGAVRALAQLRAYLTGTTTPTPVYSDVGLLSAISQPVTADSAGIFPEIYLDPAISTRVKIIESGGDFNNPLVDVDPVNTTSTIDEDDIADGAIEAKLGYTPVNPDGSTSFTSVVRYQFSPDPPSALHEDDLGYMGAPPESHDENFTFALGDTGKLIKKTNTTAYTWTIPPNSSVAFPIGHKIWVVNIGTAGAVALARGAGVILTLAGSVTDADKSIAAGGGGILMKVGTDTWKIFGSAGIT